MQRSISLFWWYWLIIFSNLCGIAHQFETSYSTLPLRECKTCTCSGNGLKSHPSPPACDTPPTDLIKPGLGTAEELAKQIPKVLFLAVYLSCIVSNNDSDMLVKAKAAEASTFKVFPF